MASTSLPDLTARGETCGSQTKGLELITPFIQCSGAESFAMGEESFELYLDITCC